jgi:hypothetical protein
MKATKPIAAALLFFLPFCTLTPAQVHGAGGGKAQIKEGLGRTWKGPTAAVFSRILTRKTPNERASRSTPTARTRPAVPSPSAPTASITFRPTADSGVAELLATAFSKTPLEKATLLELFKQVKMGYETEVAKEGKSNDLAAAMTLFIASNVVAYHNSEMPSDAETEELYNSIRGVMISTPEIARLTNAEKQQTHDWLVYMGGFVLAGHINAKNTNDLSSLADFKSIADQSMRLVLGIGPDGFTPNLRSVSSGAPPAFDHGAWRKMKLADKGI